MDTIITCPHCGSTDTRKTSNGKLSDATAKVGAVLGGALVGMLTGGIGGLLGANVIYGQTWHQYICSNCHEPFKVKMGAAGYVKEIKKY